MKKLFVLLIAVAAVVASFAFQEYSVTSVSKIEIFINDVPFVTEKLNNPAPCVKGTR